MNARQIRAKTTVCALVVFTTTCASANMDPTIDKHETIEELMADDLENWLCNLYFEIVKLPR